MTVMAIGGWQNNGELIRDAASLGYLPGLTLDMTHGLGRWWTKFRPDRLIGCDLEPAKARDVVADFRLLPWRDETFDTVVFDPPYKLNGQPTVAIDSPYGVHERATRDERHALMLDGFQEAKRVARRGGFVLVKCQDQVEGGKVRWQTDMMTVAAGASFRKVDALLMSSYRAQPDGRSQKHARRNYSTLLVFKKERSQGFS
jgi:SAM-dependent methyltransferase